MKIGAGRRRRAAIGRIKRLIYRDANAGGYGGPAGRIFIKGEKYATILSDAVDRTLCAGLA